MSMLLLHRRQGFLALLINHDADPVAENCSEKTRLKPPYESHITFSFQDLFAASHESLVVEPAASAVGPLRTQLNPGLDDILRVGEQFAAESSQGAYAQRLHDVQMLLLLAHKVVLQELVGGELEAVGGYFPDGSGEDSLVDALHASLPVNSVQAIPRISELIVRTHLHPALDQFDGRHDEGNDESCEKSIFEAFQVAEFGLVPDGLVEFVGAEADCADDGGGDEGVVDAAEELHHSLAAHDVGDDPGHAELRLHLHVHLDSVEVIARQTPHHSRKSTAYEVLQELFHRDCLRANIQLIVTSPCSYRQLTLQQDQNTTRNEQGGKRQCQMDGKRMKQVINHQLLLQRSPFRHFRGQSLSATRRVSFIYSYSLTICNLNWSKDISPLMPFIYQLEQVDSLIPLPSSFSNSLQNSVSYASQAWSDSTQMIWLSLKRLLTSSRKLRFSPQPISSYSSPFFEEITTILIGILQTFEPVACEKSANDSRTFLLVLWKSSILAKKRMPSKPPFRYTSTPTRSSISCRQTMQPPPTAFSLLRKILKYSSVGSLPVQASRKVDLPAMSSPMHKMFNSPHLCIYIYKDDFQNINIGNCCRQQDPSFPSIFEAICSENADLMEETVVLDQRMEWSLISVDIESYI